MQVCPESCGLAVMLSTGFLCHLWRGTNSPPKMLSQGCYPGFVVTSGCLLTLGFKLGSPGSRCGPRCHGGVSLCERRCQEAGGSRARDMLSADRCWSKVRAKSKAVWCGGGAEQEKGPPRGHWPWRGHRDPQVVSCARPPWLR